MVLSYGEYMQDKLNEVA